MITLLVLVLLSLTGFASVSSAMEFSDCASAARQLKNAADEAESVEQEYESAKQNYESACSYYGYDKDNSSACGRYGYHRSALESAKSNLDSKASEVSDYASRVSRRCESMSPARINFIRQLAQELQSTKQALQSCQENSAK